MRIEQDYEGLRIAAAELLEAQLTDERFDAVARFLDEETPSEQWRKLERTYATRLTLALAYYQRAIYLFELRGLDLPAHRLRPEQVRGMAAMERARDEHEQKHPPCPHCGKPLEHAAAFVCWSCNRPTKGAASH